MSVNQGQYLETYSSNHPKEVLIVKLEIDGKLDEVMVFKGFSSSLVRSTAYDPDIPVISEQANILFIDRLTAPYQPNQPNYIQQSLTWEQFQQINHA